MALVQTLKKFREETGMSESMARHLIDTNELPLVPKEQANGTDLVNLVELEERLKNNQFILPSRKKFKE